MQYVNLWDMQDDRYFSFGMFGSHEASYGQVRHLC